MANETKFIVQGNASVCVDTEVTENGEYPVQGKGVYKAIKAAVDAKAAENIPSLTGESVSVEDFNSLLDALKAAGLMVADET